MSSPVNSGKNKRNVAKWLDEIAVYNQHRMKLNTAKAALLVIDMQRYFLSKDSLAIAGGSSILISNTKQLIEAFRNEGRPVIFTAHSHHPSGDDVGILGWWWGDMIIEGTPEAEIVNQLAPLADEHVIHKHRYSAFYNTELETILRCMGVEDIVITGVMTNLCCETTAREAFVRDYRVFFIADATGTASEEMHTSSLRNLAWGFAYVTSTEELLEALGGGDA